MKSYMLSFVEYPRTEEDHNNNLLYINQQAAFHIKIVDIKPWIKNATTPPEYANNFAILELHVNHRVQYLKDVKGDKYWDQIN